MPRILAPRNLPMQQRALEKREMILSVTAKLLGTVGQDDLTTILIADKTGISVGTLYHYFPNKYSILFALSQRWLNEIDYALDDIDNFSLKDVSLRDFTNYSIDRMLNVYTDQEGILPLVQLMSGVPELKELDEEHDEKIIFTMSKIFNRLSISSNPLTLSRLSQTWLEVTHAILLIAITSKKDDKKSILSDLKHMIMSLLEKAKANF